MGSGYVGMSLAVLLAQYNEVVVLDVDASRVDNVNNKQSTIKDPDIETFLAVKELSLSATLDKHLAYEGADFIIVATPTNYDPDINRFNTNSVDTVVSNALELNENALVVVKSTIPVGHTKSLQKKNRTDRVIFSPEFLREGRALKDNLYPSRIIVGSHLDLGKEFANLLIEGAKKKDIDTLFMSPTEAEAVKLFANTYLALRVSFFNELDSYSLANDLDVRSIINGISLDPRIGGGYNNPSFGYGGYCLPKDTKQLLANYENIPQTLIKAIVTSNMVRKDFMSEEILKRNPQVVGFYRLAMKVGSDNFRSSAILEIFNKIKSKGIKVIIFEPKLKSIEFDGAKVVNDLFKFKELSDVIVANRKSEYLVDVEKKCFTRDLFGEN